MLEPTLLVWKLVMQTTKNYRSINVRQYFKSSWYIFCLMILKLKNSTYIGLICLPGCGNCIYDGHLDVLSFLQKLKARFSGSIIKCCVVYWIICLLWDPESHPTIEILIWEINFHIWAPICCQGCRHSNSENVHTFQSHVYFGNSQLCIKVPNLKYNIKKGLI